jgi:signal transduction histidine kinase
MGTVLVVILVFGAPLAVVAARLAREEADRRLQREADVVALTVESTPNAGADVLAPLAGTDTRIVLVASDGHATPIVGPTSPRQHDLVAESPTDKGVVVRLEAPAAPTEARVRRLWAVIAVAALGAALLSFVLAVVLSRRLSRPLDDLAATSSRLGAGDFRARAARSGVREMDEVADRLNATTEHLARMVERERHFSVNASHQLRTALTALRIPLEELSLADDRDEIRELTALILHQADRLQSTIEQLLALAQGERAATAEYDVRAVVDERVAVWTPVLARAGRHLRVTTPEAVAAQGSPATLRQVLDVLIDNALKHGAGDVALSVHVTSASPVVSVSDEGPGIAAGDEQAIFDRGTSLGPGARPGPGNRARPGHGVGLALARDLLAAEGGRLVLTRAAPPLFDVFLPRAVLTEPWPAEGVALVGS